MFRGDRGIREKRVLGDMGYTGETGGQGKQEGQE